MNEVKRVKGIIFDLDGVITKTDSLHFLSWTKVCNKYNLLFDN